MVKLKVRQPVAVWTGDFGCLIRINPVLYTSNQRQELEHELSR